MRRAAWGLAVLLAAGSAGAEMGMLKLKKPETKKQAGVVTTFDGASLAIAVTDGKTVSQMDFSVDALTQFKADKETLAAGKAVLVVYSVTDGKNVARVVAAQEKGKKAAKWEAPGLLSRGAGVWRPGRARRGG